jgi:hypothetical protein
MHIRRVGHRYLCKVRHTLDSIVCNQSIGHPGHRFEDCVELPPTVHRPTYDDVQFDTVCHNFCLPEFGVGLCHVYDPSVSFLLHKGWRLKDIDVFTARGLPDSRVAFSRTSKTELFVRHMSPECRVSDKDSVCICH